MLVASTSPEILNHPGPAGQRLRGGSARGSAEGRCPAKQAEETFAVGERRDDEKRQLLGIRAPGGVAPWPREPGLKTPAVKRVQGDHAAA
jgi:hypothetical protein